MSASGSPVKNSIALLDPLRALSAAAVIAWHLSGHLPFVMPVFSSAAFAVDIFMNISGFLMAYHYFMREKFEHWESGATILRFYIRRFFRIAPLYYALLLGVFFWRHPGDWQWLMLRITFLFGLIPNQADKCIMPDWSIALEMQFYAVFPFLALLIRRIGFGAFFCLCSATAWLSLFFFTYYAGTPPGLLGNFPQPTFLPLKIHIFAVGIISAGVLVKGRFVLLSKWYIPGFLFFALTCEFNYTKLLGVAYLFAYFLAASPRFHSGLMSMGGRLNQWVENREWLCWPAELTYSGYLIHNIVLAVGLDWLLSVTGFTGASILEFSALLLMVLAMVGAIGTGLLFAIERPGIRFGKRLIRSKLSIRS